MDDNKLSPLKVAGAAAGSIAAILGLVWSFETHYATAADLQEFHRTITQQMAQDKTERLEDKIFEFEVKVKAGQTLSPTDAAMYERYMRQLRMNQNTQRNLEQKK